MVHNWDTMNVSKFDSSPLRRVSSGQGAGCSLEPARAPVKRDPLLTSQPIASVYEKIASRTRLSSVSYSSFHQHNVCLTFRLSVQAASVVSVERKGGAAAFSLALA
jgi:hypothetical protein